MAKGKSKFFITHQSITQEKRREQAMGEKENIVIIKHQELMNYSGSECNIMDMRNKCITSHPELWKG